MSRGSNVTFTLKLCMAYFPEWVMKAAVYRSYGDLSEILEVVHDWPVPKELAPDQVLLTVKATAINPADWKLAKGVSGPMNPALPFIPCYDFSGVVNKIGSAVTLHAVGDEVYGFGAAVLGGGLAQYVAVPEAYLHKKPKHASWNDAAAFPLVTATAIQGLKDKAAAQKGEKIFVNGGSTAVGAVVIQIAKQWGLYVATTCSDNSREFVSKLGADEMIDYRKQRWNEVLKGQDYNIIYDCVGDAWDAGLDILKPCNTSRVVSISPPPGAWDESGGIGEMIGWVGSQAVRKVFNYFSTTPNYTFFLCDRDNMDTRKIMCDLFENQTVKVAVDSVFTLDQAKEGFARSMSGRAQGKIVFTSQ